MEIIVDKNPSVVCTLDMKPLIAKFLETYDISLAIKKNIKITKKNSDMSDDVIKRVILLGNDWNSFLLLYNENGKPDFIDLKLHQVIIKGFNVYSPGLVSQEYDRFNFSEEKKDIVDYIIMTSIMKNFSRHLEHMLSQNIVDYVNKDFQIVVGYGNEKSNNAVLR